MVAYHHHPHEYLPKRSRRIYTDLSYINVLFVISSSLFNSEKMNRNMGGAEAYMGLGGGSISAESMEK